MTSNKEGESIDELLQEGHDGISRTEILCLKNTRKIWKRSLF